MDCCQRAGMHPWRLIIVTPVHGCTSGATWGLIWGSPFAPLNWSWTGVFPKWQFYSWSLGHMHFWQNPYKHIFAIQFPSLCYPWWNTYGRANCNVVNIITYNCLMFFCHHETSVVDRTPLQSWQGCVIPERGISMLHPYLWPYIPGP